MAITINGTGTTDIWTGGSSHVSTFTFGGTVQANALLVLAISLVSPSVTPITVSSITDASGNTWAKFNALENHAGWLDLAGGQVSGNLEVWYTFAASVGTSLAVTMNLSGTVDSAGAAISPKIVGANVAQPFDQNANATKTLLQHSAGVTPTISGISTTTTHLYPIYAFGSPGFNAYPGTLSFAGTSNDEALQNAINGTNQCRIQMSLGATGGPGVTGPYSSVAFTPGSAVDNALAIAFNVTADAQAGGLLPSARAQIVG